MSDWTRDEMMTVAAARQLWDGCVCFVGIGLPSAACNLARLTHAPDVVLIYESGTLETRPDVLPLSIGDGELADTAACVIPLPEGVSYLLQAGRVDDLGPQRHEHGVAPGRARPDCDQGVHRGPAVPASAPCTGR